MEQTIEISLDDRGRLLIPAAIKERLGLLPGMHLIVEPGDKENVCLRVDSSLPRIVDKGGVLVIRSELTGDLDNITRMEREHRVSTLIQRVNT